MYDTFLIFLAEQCTRSLVKKKCQKKNEVALHGTSQKNRVSNRCISNCLYTFWWDAVCWDDVCFCHLRQKQSRDALVTAGFGFVHRVVAAKRDKPIRLCIACKKRLHRATMAFARGDAERSCSPPGPASFDVGAAVEQRPNRVGCAKRSCPKQRGRTRQSGNF